MGFSFQRKVSKTPVFSSTNIIEIIWKMFSIFRLVFGLGGSANSISFFDNRLVSKSLITALTNTAWNGYCCGTLGAPL